MTNSKIDGMIEVGLRAAERAASEYMFGREYDFEDGFTEGFKERFREIHRAALEAALAWHLERIAAFRDVMGEVFDASPAGETAMAFVARFSDALEAATAILDADK